MAVRKQAYPVQLELPLFHQKTNPIQQMEETIQSMLTLTWNIALAHISKRTTKELMRQHGKLVAFYDGKVRIKLSTLPIFRLATQKISEIESAFKKAFGITIKVYLEV